MPTQCEATFEIEEYFKINYMYECIIVLRALLLQKQAPAKWKKLMSLESHFEERKGTESWTRTQENIIDVMKKTLGKLTLLVVRGGFLMLLEWGRV